MSTQARSSGKDVRSKTVSGPKVAAVRCNPRREPMMPVTAALVSEARQLAKTLGFDIVGSFTQKRARFDQAAYFGVGKRQEISRFVRGKALAAEADRWFAWRVVAFGSGILAYFGLASEPSSVEAAAAAGVSIVVQPGGSVRDEEVIARADELGLVMVFTGERHFLH